MNKYLSIAYVPEHTTIKGKTTEVSLNLVESGKLM